MAATADQLAAKLAAPAKCVCTPRHVGTCHTAAYPNGPVTCQGCPELLDPSLWPTGLHVGCTPPPPPAPTLPFTAPAGTQTHPLKKQLTGIVNWCESSSERSQQTAIGPSEIGTDCLRRIGYRVTGTPTCNTNTDPWFAVVGTAVHAWLGGAIDSYQQWQLDRPAGGPNPRYLVEQRVHMSDTVAGSCDLFDVDTGTVIDHKIVGAASLRKYRDNGPSNQYRTQVHLYGYGHARAGRTVNEVAIAFFPRSSYLADLHIWSEPYQEGIATAALNRLDTVRTVAAAAGPTALPATPDPVGCTWCDFYRPGKPADATGCPGAGN